jgi:predicted deacetylase
MSRLPLAFRLVLGTELALWTKAGHTPVLWWRDDDARVATGALEQLLALSRRHGAPLTLAAIAGPSLSLLVRRTQSEPHVELAVHGFKHVNRQPEGQGFGEIIDSDDTDWVRAQLRATVMLFHRAGVAPTLFVPPWNNVKPRLLEALPDSSITVVSGFSQASGLRDGVMRLDAHLDVLRWKGGGRFRGTWRFLSRMRRLMIERRKAGQWDEPIGLLTHHLDHDKETWLFLESFLAAFRVTTRRDLTGEAAIQPEALSA